MTTQAPRGATPPGSGGEFLKTLPSSGKEGWRAERRGGSDRASSQHPRQISRVALGAQVIGPYFVIKSAFAGSQVLGKLFARAASDIQCGLQNPAFQLFNGPRGGHAL